MNGAKKGDMPTSLPDNLMSPIEIRDFLRGKINLKYVEIFVSRDEKSVYISIHDISLFYFDQIIVPRDDNEWELIYCNEDNKPILVSTVEEIKNEILRLEPIVRPEFKIIDDIVPININRLLLIDENIAEVIVQKLKEKEIHSKYEICCAGYYNKILITLENSIRFKLANQIYMNSDWEIKIINKGVSFQEIKTFADIIDYINNHLDK